MLTPDAVGKAHCNPFRSMRPNVDVATSLAVSGHIDSRPTPPSAGTSFGLIVIAPPPYDPKVPHHDLDDEPEMYRLYVAVPAHRNRRALTARAAGASTPPLGEPRQPADWRHACDHNVRTTDRHPLPEQQLPVRSVVTFLDRDRRTVFGTVTELRHHEAIVAGGETGRWRVHHAELPLIKAGPTARATLHAPARSPTRSSGLATDTTPCARRPRGTSAARRNAAVPSRTA